MARRVQRGVGMARQEWTDRKASACAGLDWNGMAGSEGNGLRRQAQSCKGRNGAAGGGGRWPGGDRNGRTGLGRLG